MDLQNLLEVAADLCLKAHTGQRDKAGKAYFLHPFRVALACEKDEEKIVALLHDVLEDSDLSPNDLLKQGFPQDIVDAVVSVTKQDSENYEDFIVRAKKNPIGRVVKLHDLEDNLDASRLDTFTPDMAGRFTKYVAALRFMQSDDKPQEESKTLRTIHELYTALRQEENRKIQSRAKHTGGTNFMRDHLIIRDKGKTVIDESSIFDTLCKIGNIFGFDSIADSNITASKGRDEYYLVKSCSTSDRYKLCHGWHVLSKIPVVSVALALNEYFELANAKFIASVVDRQPAK